MLEQRIDLDLAGTENFIDLVAENLCFVNSIPHQWFTAFFPSSSLIDLRLNFFLPTANLLDRNLFLFGNRYW